MTHHDTICAVSTPAGVGGIAVVRLSGPEARTLAESVLRRPDGTEKPIALADHRARLAHLYDGDDFLDEVVATLFAAPRSYSGDDVVEIACHGSLYVQRQALALFVARGARLAEPGEFTLRAFLNGRLDLSQAEAVADLIDSRSRSAHRLAVSQLRGGYARQLEELRRQLVDTTALLELELDFSEEDLQFARRDHLLAQVTTLRDHVRRLIDSYRMGNALKQGVPVAIVGRPNVGKSTLLNALLHDDRAIVSPVAGTTRDTVEELFTIDGILFRLIDTAGLHRSDDTVEQAGIERSRRAMQQAAIILYVTDDDTLPDLTDLVPDDNPTSDEEKRKNEAPSTIIHHTSTITHPTSYIQDLEDKTLILLRNKIDLTESGKNKEPEETSNIIHPTSNIQPPEPGNTSTIIHQPSYIPNPEPGNTSTIIHHTSNIQPPEPGNTSTIIHQPSYITISAKRGDNLDRLCQLLVESVRKGIQSDDVLLTNARHHEALQHVDAALGEVLQDMESGVGPDLVSVDLRDALYHLGTITGTVTSDEVLGNIFSRFCVGK